MNFDILLAKSTLKYIICIFLGFFRYYVDDRLLYNKTVTKETEMDNSEYYNTDRLHSHPDNSFEDILAEILRTLSKAVNSEVPQMPNEQYFKTIPVEEFTRQLSIALRQYFDTQLTCYEAKDSLICKFKQGDCFELQIATLPLSIG